MLTNLFYVCSPLHYIFGKRCDRFNIKNVLIRIIYLYYFKFSRNDFKQNQIMDKKYATALGNLIIGSNKSKTGIYLLSA